VMIALVQTNFSGYPLVSGAQNQVVGLVLRDQLLQALHDTGVDDADAGNTVSPSTKQVINLMVYADKTPEVKHWNTPLARAHRHFSAAGLRHLIIVDEAHRLLGILTRSDLAPLTHPRTRRRAIAILLAEKRRNQQESGLDENGIPDCSEESCYDDDSNHGQSFLFPEGDDTEDEQSLTGGGDASPISPRTPGQGQCVPGLCVPEPASTTSP